MNHLNSHLLLLVTIFRLVVCPSKQTDSSALGHRIVNGDPVNKLGKYPFMVSIGTEKEGHICGGTILNDDTILTAGHCVYGDAKPTYVYIGNVDISGRLSARYKYPIARCLLYPKYDTIVQNGGDIALIKLARKIDFTANYNQGRVGKVCIPSGPKDEPDRGHLCIGIGWGRNGSNHLQSTLQEVKLKVRLRFQFGCGLLFRPSKCYCAVGPTKNQTMCFGDSGGPLLCRAANGAREWLQYGITSYGFPIIEGKCKHSGHSAFTMVNLYTKWILKNGH